jgi:hypothetical protein
LEKSEIRFIEDVLEIPDDDFTSEIVRNVSVIPVDTSAPVTPTKNGFTVDSYTQNRGKMDRGASVKFDVGDVVLVFKSTSAKYDPRWRGPVIVKKLEPNGDLSLSDGTLQSQENVKKFVPTDPAGSPISNRKFLTVEELKLLCNPNQITRGYSYVWFKPASQVSALFGKGTLVGAIADLNLLNDQIVPYRMLLTLEQSKQNHFLIWLPSDGNFVWALCNCCLNFLENFDSFEAEARANDFVWFNVQIALETTDPVHTAHDPVWVKHFEQKLTRPTTASRRGRLQPPPTALV